MENTQFYVAKTFAGIEPLLADELAALGARNCKILSRSVSFEGDMDLMYKANYFCRFALRILWLQKKFTFTNNRQFYEQIFDFPAEKFMGPDNTLAVHATIADTIFKTPLYASVLAKDAVCDRFRDLDGRRPSVDKENPDVQLHLHVYKNEAQLFLDSSGESLHKRGYKVMNHPAPINEVVAAAMIKLSCWKADCDFIDPMCGGGTILIEAAMQALNIPAGFFREHYGFERWKNFDHRLWQRVTDEADIHDDVPVNFYSSDISARFLGMAEANVKAARLSDFIRLFRKAMRDTQPKRTPATLIFNPPYGERLDMEEIDDFYKEIGDTLKQNYAGCTAFIISSNMQAIKHIGLHPSKKTTLFNGALECKFLRYDLYAGKR